MTIKDYHADTTFASKSALDILNRSPWEYYCKKLFPAMQQQNPLLRDPVPQHVREEWNDPAKSRHFVIGNAVDCLILEPHTWNQRFFVTTDRDRRTSGGKAEHQDIVRANVGKEWLTPSEKRDVDAMVAAVKSSWLHFFVDQARTQNTFKWTDPIGIQCKCRPDWLLTIDDNLWARFLDEFPGEHDLLRYLMHECMGLDSNNQPHGLSSYDEIICDLKTLNGSWPSHVVDYRYYVQAPFYLDGIDAAMNDGKRRGFMFMVVGVEWPNRVDIQTLPEAALRIGRSEYQRNLATLLECRETGEWPKPGDAFQQTEMPSWFMFKHRNS